MKSVVFLDLDGTFWKYGQVPASALEAVRRAQANGHLVFSNTGRSRGETPDLVRYGLDGRCYAVGNEIYLGEQRIFDQPLGMTRAREIFRALEGVGVVIAEGGERCYIHDYTQGFLAELRAQLEAHGEYILRQPDTDEMVDEDFAQVYKYSVYPEGGLEALRALPLPPDMVLTPMTRAAEITQSGCDKGVALKRVLDYLGGSFRSVALGDSDNDIPMFEAADVAVAMGNATPAARAHADVMTARIEEDGLAKAFDQLGLL
ncbi:MAG: HAD family hydrolase [Atopobiaceae bacterium]